MLYSATEIEEAAYAGGTVYLADDTEVLLDRPVTVTNPVTFVGGKLRTNGTPAFDILSSGVSVYRTEFHGKGTSTGRATAEKLIQATGTLSNPLEEIFIRNAKFYGSASDNVYLSYVDNSEVSGNRIKDYLYSGVMLVSCHSVLVSKNRISDAPLTSGVVNTYGIAATDTLNTIAARSTDILITQNILDNMEWEGIDTHGGQRISVTDNILTNCVRGIAFVAGNNTRITVPIDCLATGNVLDGMGSSREGICLYGIPGVPADAVINSNRVTGYVSPLVTSYYNRAKTRVGGNSVPHLAWTDITLQNGWRANTNYKPQYMVDGDQVFLRGMVIPPSPFNPSIGAISTSFAPEALAFIRQSKGSNVAAGEGTFSVGTKGELTMYYHNIADTYSYPIEGQYRMI